MRTSSILRATLTVLPILVIAACTEPKREVISPAEPASLKAQLIISDSSARASSEVVVSVLMRGTSASTIGSYTARVAYDTTALKYVSDASPEDAATRVSNADGGVVRIAGIAAEGFKDGALYVARFTVLKPQFSGSLRVTFDELHTRTQADVLGALESRTP